MITFVGIIQIKIKQPQSAFQHHVYHALIITCATLIKLEEPTFLNVKVALISMKHKLLKH